MAQPGNFTPILLYASATPSNVPTASNLTNSANGAETAINYADGRLFYKNTSNVVTQIADRTWIGTVTNVTGTSPVAVATGTSTPVVSLSAGYGDTQNPYASKTANNFLAAPNGSPGVPTFRAIVAADIPTLNQNTTGSAATLTTARNLWGQSFNGSADISAPLYPAVGSVSAPAYSASGDTNTGIFFPTADTIAFSEGGVEAARFDASGNLGVGTTSPTAKLNVSRTDSTLIGLFSGTTKGARIGTTATYSFIEGVDTTGSASYQPFMVGGEDIRFTTSDIERCRIDASGNLLIATTNTSAGAGAGIKLLAAGNGASNPLLSIVQASSANTEVNYSLYSTGAAAYRFYVGGAGTVFATSTTITGISDQRLKENIVDLPDGLDTVMALKPRKFDWKAGKGKDIKGDRGFIAQEFEFVFPDMIEQWKDEPPEGEEPYKAINANLIPTLVKAIQEQQAMIQELKTRLNAL
jgi:hypothetical protein